MRPKRVRLGYSPGGPTRWPIRSCFNEAQACPPGIFHIVRIQRPHIVLASMRPKRVRLGFGMLSYYLLVKERKKAGILCSYGWLRRGEVAVVLILLDTLTPIDFFDTHLGKKRTR